MLVLWIRKPAILPVIYPKNQRPEQVNNSGIIIYRFPGDVETFLKAMFICHIQQLKEKKNPTFECRLASKVFSRDKSTNHFTKPQPIVI